MKPAEKARRFYLGIFLAAFYVVIVAAVYCLIRNSPPDDGMEWIPFVMLAMPWYKMGPQLLIPGLVLNAGIFFGIGTAIEVIWRRNFGSRHFARKP
jgi:hypothetical protein